MYFRQVVIVFTLLGVIATSLGHIGGYEMYKNMPPSNYCGKRLSLVMAVLCDDDAMIKRSGNSYVQPSSYGEHENSVGWPWMSHHMARSMDHSSRGKRQFIISECCEKPCSIEELVTYC